VESVRVDRWLAAARIFKSRSQAASACTEGHVRINGAIAKASHPVKVDDEIATEAPRGTVIVDVKVLSDKRLSAPLARALYADRSPPPPLRESPVRAGPPNANAEPCRDFAVDSRVLLHRPVMTP
jgi:ribosome-associated heat shock protein Hsp15